MRLLGPFVLTAFIIAAARVALAAPSAPATAAPQATNTPVPVASPQSSPTLSNPFASPSPSSSPEVGVNGYAALFFDSVFGSGGTYVPVGSSPTPVAFPASSGHGFTLDVTGRISPQFEGSLRIEDDSLHGGDNPISTVTEGALLYGPQGRRAAFGVGIVSFQRSSGLQSATGAGVGIALAPDDVQTVSLFGKFFLYPSLQFQAIGPQPASHAALLSYEAGVAFAPPARGGLFFSLGIAGHSGAPSAYSPQSLNALQLGVGTRF